jgi:hypothetical protein
MHVLMIGHAQINSFQDPDLAIECDRDELVKSSVLQGLLTTRLFPTRAQAEAAAARYNDLVDKIALPQFYDGGPRDGRRSDLQIAGGCRVLVEIPR